MKALPLIVLLTLAGAAGAVAAEGEPPAALVIDDLRFEVRSDRNEGRIEIESDSAHSHVTVERARASAAAGLEPGAGDGPVHFAIVAEAGTITCNGKRSGARATGDCRFVSDPAYETGLAQRRVPLERRRDLLALALVDARLALVDDLSRDGLRPDDSGDLIAAAALGVTGAWAHELKTGGLVISDFDDLIAARALDVDGTFVKAMAAAGYPQLTARQAITMKAVGVTPGYADAMNRAANAAHAVEGIGGLQ